MKQNTDYVIYANDNGVLLFMDGNKGAIEISGLNSNAPYQVGGSWTLTTAAMGTDKVANISWQIVDEVLQVFITYKFTTRLVTPTEESMSEIVETIKHEN